MAVCDSRLESIVGDLPVLQASMRSKWQACDATTRD
jgi:hypothetical protein